jgi:hypothetical protein
MIGNNFAETHKKLQYIMEREGGIMPWVVVHNCIFRIEKFQLMDVG